MSLKLVFLFAFLAIQVSCEDKGSLAFIIDDTGSPYDVLPQIRYGAKEILDAILSDDAIPIEDVIVVTFNDPEVKLRTRTLDRRLLREAMRSIKPYGGNDCPVMSLSGIKKGLQETRPGSFLYVFTDASAKDYDKFEEVKSLCLEKKSKITFILTGDCGNNNSQMDQVYNDIAETCDGDVIRIDKEQVKTVFEYITEYLQVTKNITTSQKLSPSERTEIKFRKDHSTDYVLASASGTDVQLSVVDKEGTTVEDRSELKNFKVLKLQDLAPGEVTVKVRSASSGHVVIYSHTARASWPTIVWDEDN